MIDPVQQLKTKLAEIKRLLVFTKDCRKSTTVELLKEISSLVSSSFDIVITDLSYENTVVSIKGEAKND